MFRIEYDAAANILHATVAGFWTPEEVPAFAKALGAAAQDARAVREDFDGIVHSPDFPVQANDVADLLGNVGQAMAKLTSGRMAIVVGSHLNRMQAERTLAHPRLRVFMTDEEALDWLRTS